MKKGEQTVLTLVVKSILIFLPHLSCASSASADAKKVPALRFPIASGHLRMTSKNHLSVGLGLSIPNDHNLSILVRGLPSMARPKFG